VARSVSTMVLAGMVVLGLVVCAGCRVEKDAEGTARVDADSFAPDPTSDRAAPAPATPTETAPAPSVKQDFPSGPPPMVQLTLASDTSETTIPVHCPVPQEFCSRGVQVFNDDGSYLGLGFDLPEGTPVFAMAAGELSYLGTRVVYWFEGESYTFYYRLRVGGYTVTYEHSGHSAFFPDPETVNGEVVFPTDSGSIRVDSGQAVGKVVSKWTQQGYTSDGITFFYANLVLTARDYHGAETPLRLRLQPTG
jgi:hypothetical protein